METQPVRVGVGRGSSDVGINRRERKDDGTIILGARLWDPPGAPWADDKAPKIFRREIELAGYTCTIATL